MSTLLPTWSGRSQFKYDGSVTKGTDIFYGNDFQFKYPVKATVYEQAPISNLGLTVEKL